MTKHPTQKQGMATAAFFSPLSVKGAAFLLIFIIIVTIMIAGYLLERKAELRHAARTQKKNFGPQSLDRYLCSARDRKLNELLVAKHHEPVHPNLFWLLLIPACLFASPVLAQGSVGHSGGFLSNPIVILIFIGTMLAALSKRSHRFNQPKTEKNEQ